MLQAKGLYRQKKGTFWIGGLIMLLVGCGEITTEDKRSSTPEDDSNPADIALQLTAANGSTRCKKLINRYKGKSMSLKNVKAGSTIQRKKGGPIILVGQTLPKNVKIKIEKNNSGSVILGNKFANYSMSYGSVIRTSGDNVLLACNEFINIRGTTKGKDMHAMSMASRGKNVVIMDNLCENVGADCFQAGDSNKYSSKYNPISNIYFVNNTARITNGQKVGENAVDIKNAAGPVHILRNYVSGYRPCPNGSRPGCSNSGGYGVIAHYKNKNVKVRYNVFENNTGHVKYAYKKNFKPDLLPTGGEVTNNIWINSKATKKTLNIEDNPGPAGRKKPKVKDSNNKKAKSAPKGFCAGRRTNGSTCANVKLGVTLPSFAR